MSDTANSGQRDFSMWSMKGDLKNIELGVPAAAASMTPPSKTRHVG